MLTKFSSWEPTYDINSNCMHTRLRNWTQVASLGGEIANHYTRGAGWSSNSIFDPNAQVVHVTYHAVLI